MAAVLAAAGSLCIGAVALSSAQSPASEVLPTLLVPGDRTELSVTWLGDTLFGDAAQPSIDRFGLGWVTERMKPLDADVVVANLEGPITESIEVWDPSQRWSYQSPPSVAAELARLGVDVGGLANNHAMDRGPQGLADTVRHLTDAGIRPIGAGQNSAESRLPLMVESAAGTLGIVAFYDTGEGSGTDRAGVRRLTLENLIGAHDLARSAGATWVTAFVHWGVNYTGVTETQRAWASAFAGAGYDLVVGSGSHLFQPMEVVEGMPVAYSLGNWVFGTPGRYANHDLAGRGLVLTTTFSSSPHLTISAECIVTDNEIVAFQPRPCSGADAAARLGALNPAVRMVGDRAVFELPLGSSRE